MFGLRNRVMTGAVALVVLLTAVALAFFYWGLPAHSAQGSVALVAVDVDPTGNDDSTVGAIQTWIPINNTDSIDVDLVMRASTPPTRSEATSSTSTTTRASSPSSA